tara:strand:+ start:375 stop:653 length:279 start_codon:yes stop_codon:yes gene_type:complete
MTRSELVDAILEKNPEMTQKQAENLMSVILNEITNTLSEGGRVELRGFGVFSVRQREEREGRNPRTGETVTVKAKGVPFFKAGKLLKDRLNK